MAGRDENNLFSTHQWVLIFFCFFIEPSFNELKKNKKQNLGFWGHRLLKIGMRIDETIRDISFFLYYSFLFVRLI
jgi:hypothetical protein